LTKHRSYDRFLQLAHSNKKYTYEEAKDLFFASIKDFPATSKRRPIPSLKRAMSMSIRLGEAERRLFQWRLCRWQEKLHPVILFNFQGELDDCFTVAHESGHSIHTLYSMESSRS
jgi:oligoendopeptidase F